MQDTLLIQSNQQKAIQLLYDMEALDLIKVVKEKCNF